MLASITPLGERGRDNRYGLTASAFVVGSTAGGAMLGAVLGAVGGAARAVAPDGAPLTALALALLGAAAVVGLAADLEVGGLRLPTLRRQVNEDWLASYRGWVYGAGYGWQLGAGVVTIVTASATYVTFAAALLTLSLAGGAGIGAVYGLARALPVLSTARVRHPAALHAMHRRNQRWAGPARRAVLGAQAAMLLIIVFHLITVI